MRIFDRKNSKQRCITQSLRAFLQKHLPGPIPFMPVLYVHIFYLLEEFLACVFTMSSITSQSKKINKLSSHYVTILSRNTTKSLLGGLSMIHAYPVIEQSRPRSFSSAARVTPCTFIQTSIGRCSYSGSDL